ncbi:hypothetical protein C8J56DRAFT_464919 [Mycena floridula]|nr:hypothetical protein C8J56DRAFT_464919 [Mycena floridula]
MQVVSLDNLSPEQHKIYNKAWFDFFQKRLGIPSNRGYITFIDPGRAYLGRVVKLLWHRQR